MTRIQYLTMQRQESVPWIFLLISGLIFIIISSLAFYHNLPYLFYANDGHYMMTLAKSDRIWRGFEFGFSNNFFQSIGDIWFPLNTLFFPGYLIPTLLTDNISYSEVASYVIFASEFFLIGLLISRIIGLSWNGALISAWVLPLLTFPYYYYPLLYNIISLVPQTGTMIVASDLLILLFIYLGRNSLSCFWINTLCITLLLVYIMIANPASMLMTGPMVTLVCLIYLILCFSKPEKKSKIIFLIPITLFAIPLLIYLYSLIKFTTSYYADNNIVYGSLRLSWYFISLLFQGLTNWGPWLFITSFFGMILFSLYGDHFQKLLARSMLTSVILLVGFGISLVYFSYWIGPPPIYLEFILWPFYVCYSVALLSFVCRSVAKIGFSKWRMNMNLVLRPVILILPSALLFLAKPIGDCWNVPKQPTKTPIVSILDDQISLFPGKQFNGRVANFTGLKMGDGVTWGSDLAGNDNKILFASGNDHRMNGLWFYNIPTLDMYNHLMSPIYFKFATSFFSRPNDEQNKRIIPLRHINIKWLAALGVRFVITDVKMKGALQRKTMFIKDVGYLYLYELPNVNIGQYTPSHVLRLTHSTPILAMLNQKTFDPQSRIITDSELPDKIVPAKNGKLYVDKGHLKIIAESAGYSIILLPLEYSRCLNITSNITEKEKPFLFRANMTQTGVLFHNQLNASIRYFTGPFYSSTCRLKDAHDFEKMAGRIV